MWVATVLWCNSGTFCNCLMTTIGGFARPYELTPWCHCSIMWEQPAGSQMRSQESKSWSVIAGLDVLLSALPATSQPCFLAPTAFKETFTLSWSALLEEVMSEYEVCTVKSTAWVQMSCQYVPMLDFAVISGLCFHVIGRRYSQCKQPPSVLSLCPDRVTLLCDGYGHHRAGWAWSWLWIASWKG